MPLRLEIKRELFARSERVKCVDVHPSEPWILAALFSGNVVIWNYTTEVVVKTFEASDVPVRAAKFIPRMQWFICGADDMQIRVYNYNTMEKVHTFEGHSDYIRGLAIHPKSPYVLSASDDMSIKMWDWSRNWENSNVFEGHTHYVMQVEFNPKDSNSFASASLDRSVKIWGLNSRTPHFSLEGHERGVNCISFFTGGDRPFLVSGADDQTIKVWDYQTKSCVSTLEGHTNNVSAVLFHPVLPIILSGSEDGTIRIWHSTTFRHETTLNYGLERVWTLSAHKDSNRVAAGYDDGSVMIKLGHEEPVVSMDRNGKVVWAKNHEIIGANVKTASSDEYGDGERLPLATREMGSCEIYPQDIVHDPKARLLAVCGDGEYIIYTALSLKNKSFGQALDFVWAAQSGIYATRSSSSSITVFKNFEEYKSFSLDFTIERIFGGHLLALVSQDFVDFYDWESCCIVRRIEICPVKVFWAETGDVAVVACETSFYILNYNHDLVSKFIAQQIEVGEQGIDGSFTPEKEVHDTVCTAKFVGDCFIYTTIGNRLNYCVGTEVITLAHLDRPYYLLGYLPKENRVYLIDKHHSVVSFKLLVSVLVYETAIVRRDMDAAAEAFNAVAPECYDSVARFLEGQGLLNEALNVTTDIEHQFELALQLKNLPLARELTLKDESPTKWKQVGDAALAQFDLDLARFCFERSNDFGGLLLLTTALGDREGVEKLADLAIEKERFNVAFASLFIMGKIDECIDVLVRSKRLPEATIMARSYAPSRVASLVQQWRADMNNTNKTLADSLASPDDNADSFPQMNSCLTAEKFLKAEREEILPASVYEAAKARRTRDLLQASENGELPCLLSSNAGPQPTLGTLSAQSSSPRSPVSHTDSFTHSNSTTPNNAFFSKQEQHIQRSPNNTSQQKKNSQATLNALPMEADTHDDVYTSTTSEHNEFSMDNIFDVAPTNVDDEVIDAEQTSSFQQAQISQSKIFQRDSVNTDFFANDDDDDDGGVVNEDESVSSNVTHTHITQDTDPLAVFDTYEANEMQNNITSASVSEDTLTNNIDFFADTNVNQENSGDINSFVDDETKEDDEFDMDEFAGFDIDEEALDGAEPTWDEIEADFKDLHD